MLGLTPQFNDILLYTAPTGRVKIEVFFEGETFWLSQRKMAELFGVDVRTVNEHLQNIYKTNELIREATIRNFRIVQPEGIREVSREVEFYNLDAIIGVGYRVNSYQATQFRIWATQTLREFIIKGFVLNDEMLKNGKPFGKDYFDELLERIREIRASERRAYQKLADIFEQCSADYSPRCARSKELPDRKRNRGFESSGKCVSRFGRVSGSTTDDHGHERLDTAHQ